MPGSIETTIMQSARQTLEGCNHAGYDSFLSMPSGLDPVCLGHSSVYHSSSITYPFGSRSYRSIIESNPTPPPHSHECISTIPVVRTSSENRQRGMRRQRVPTCGGVDLLHGESQHVDEAAESQGPCRAAEHHKCAQCVAKGQHWDGHHQLLHKVLLQQGEMERVEGR